MRCPLALPTQCTAHNNYSMMAFGSSKPRFEELHERGGLVLLHVQHRNLLVELHTHFIFDLSDSFFDDLFHAGHLCLATDGDCISEVISPRRDRTMDFLM